VGVVVGGGGVGKAVSSKPKAMLSTTKMLRIRKRI